MLHLKIKPQNLFEGGITMFQTTPFTVCDAKFIGKNGSMGYIHGKLYRIRISFGERFLIVFCKGHEPCPYDTQTAFFANWEIYTGEL